MTLRISMLAGDIIRDYGGSAISATRDISDSFALKDGNRIIKGKTTVFYMSLDNYIFVMPYHPAILPLLPRSYR